MKIIKYDPDKTRFELGKPFFIHYCENTLMPDWELQYHDTLEIFFLVEGKYNFFIDDKIYELHSGDMVLIPPGVLHKAFAVQNIPITRYIIYCNTSLIPKMTGKILLTSGYYVQGVQNSLRNIENIFFKISNEYNNIDVLSEELIHGYVTELAKIIFRERKNQNLADMICSNSIVEAAVAYIKNNYSNDISLKDVAHHVSLSDAHLSRTFKSITGLGVREYLTIYRLKQAEFMLIEYPSKSISEIAYDCGFNDSNYFSSRLKKAIGVTPTEYRKSKSHFFRNKN